MFGWLLWLVLLAPTWLLILMDATRQSTTLKIWIWCVGISYTLLVATYSHNFPMDVGYPMGFGIAIIGLYFRELRLSQASKEGKLTKQIGYHAILERFQTELIVRLIQVSPMIGWIYAIITSPINDVIFWIGVSVLIGVAIQLTINENKLWKD